MFQLSGFYYKPSTLPGRRHDPKQRAGDRLSKAGNSGGRKPEGLGSFFSAPNGFGAVGLGFRV